MGLLDAHADSIERGAMAARPGPAAEPSFRLGAFGASLFQSVPAGLLEVFASVRDFSNAVDERHAAEVQAREKRLGLKPGAAYRVGDGRDARKRADQFMPDPLTAHLSEQMLAGFGKTITKAGTSMLALGPVGGAGAFGLLEADNEAQRLMDKGVDSRTAWHVGGVVGAVSAVGVALPISGAAMATTAGGKVAATAALATAGGPASFVGQQALSREILQRAGHEDEAKLRDPLDPVGLAASMFPFVLGGVAVRRSIKAMGSVKTEADMKGAVQLTPAEQAASDAFERSAGNMAELRAAIAAEKRPAERAILQAELQNLTTKTQTKATQAAAAHVEPEMVDAARVAVSQEHLARVLPPEPMAHAEMLRAADMVAAGERVDDIPDFAPVAAAPRSALEQADDLRQMAASAYWAQVGGKMIRDPSTAVDPTSPDAIYYGNVTARTTWIPAEEWFGRMRGTLGREGLSSQDDIKAAVEKGAAGLRLSPKEARTLDWMKLELQSMREEIARIRGSDDAPHLSSDAMAAGLSRQDSPDVAAVARAAELDEIALERAAIQYENDDGAFMAEVWRIISAAERAKADQQSSGNDAGGAQARSPQEGAAADIPGAEAGQKVADVTTASASADAKVVKAMAEADPSMRVMLPGDEKATTLAAALERIEAEKKADLQEADLYRVAVQCFLTGGAAI